MTNRNSLKRFLDAQETAYQTALSEIGKGRKKSHWMWYIFPQIEGLGFSETSKFYAIRDLDEAKAFYKHPVLGPRLVHICRESLQLETSDAYKIFGSPDDVKLKSSMTLFSSLVDTDPIFRSVLEKFFNGRKDTRTLALIDSHD